MALRCSSLRYEGVRDNLLSHGSYVYSSYVALRRYNAVVTPLRKAASYEPRTAILGIWGDTWLTRGKYGIYVAVRGTYEALTGST